ncbi:MAG: hypothetical protein LQ339_006397 [Xanthoria mediterranea]|nr:MAG: hypothetical protein LQ339_006397 [Xanthoria mediterranea]
MLIHVAAGSRAVDDDEDGGTARLWLLLLELLLDVSVLEATLVPSSRLEAEVPVVEDLDRREVGLVKTLDSPKPFEPVTICGPVLELPGKVVPDDIDTLDLDSDAELLYKLVLELRGDTTLEVARALLLLDVLTERPGEVTKLVEDRAELELVVSDPMTLDDPFVELVDCERPEVALANTPDVLMLELDAAELEMAKEEIAADVEDVKDEVNVDVKFTERLEDAADDVVEFASDEDRLEPVVRLARRLDAEADDELGAAVDTPILSALIISAAYCKCQPI